MKCLSGDNFASEVKAKELGDNVHSHLHHSKRPMAVGGRGGQAMAILQGRSGIFVLKLKNCVEL